MLIDQLLNVFVQSFGKADLCIKAPGRANIIGEHIDYHEGQVLPFALDQGIYFIFAERQDQEIKIHSYNNSSLVECSVGSFEYTNQVKWFEYLSGALSLLKIPYGFNLSFGGDLPIGAGMSSSSALTLGFIFGLNQLFSLGLSPKKMVEKASIAENKTGVLGGTMDQNAIMFGKKNHALHIDFYKSTMKGVELNDNLSWLLIDTGVKHKLLETGYNNQRSLSESALQILNEHYSFSHFRELSLSIFLEHKSIFSEDQFLSLKHIIEENKRVATFVQEISNNLKYLGELLYESHHGLSKEYKVSCRELDELVQLAKDHKDFFGARMMGGGFGGCTINLVSPEIDLSSINSRFNVYPISPSRGIHLI